MIHNYAMMIPGWSNMTGREKFNALARLRRGEREREERARRITDAAMRRRERRKSQREAELQQSRDQMREDLERARNRDGFMELDRAAEEAGVSGNTVRRYIRAGSVECERIGRFTFVCLAQVLAEKQASYERKHPNVGASKEKPVKRKKQEEPLAVSSSRLAELGMITIEQAMETAGVSRATLKRYISSGMVYSVLHSGKRYVCEKDVEAAKETKKGVKRRNGAMIRMKIRLDALSNR